MPLTAIIDGKTIIAPTLSKEEWNTLKRQHKKGLQIKMLCCGESGHPRISKNGTQHFYHAHDVGCDWENETIDHLEIKNLIFQTCKSENWETYTEYPSPDREWISDVFAIKNSKKIVFEVQISKIPINVLEERDKKYQNEGIESYWLLNNYFEKPSEFRSGYDDLLYEVENRLEDNIPYIDNSLFHTGSENHVFISKGIRTVGLKIDNKTIYTTHNPSLTLQEWVKQVLNGEYKKYLDDNLIFFKEKLQLKKVAAPLLLKFNEFYCKIILDKTYKKNIDSYYKIFKTNDAVKKITDLKERFGSAYFESDRLDKDYRSMISPKYGVFYWKLPPWNEDEEPFFRLESESKITELKQCVDRLILCEGFYNSAFNELKHEIDLSLEKQRKEIEIENITLQNSEERRDPAQLELFGKDGKLLTRSRDVLFVTSSELKEKWLSGSRGMKYQVGPSLLYKFPEEVAIEFEQKGYGEIINDE